MRYAYLTVLLTLLQFPIVSNAFTWHSSSTPAVVKMPEKRDKVVDIAFAMFCDDMTMVTGSKPAKNAKNANIIIKQLDKASAKELKKLRSLGIDTDKLAASSDAFALKACKGKIYAIGNNGRGSAYALLELSRMAGVSPWVWWGDNIPDHRNELSIDDNYYTLQCPSVERRGIFINDEDWSILPWSHLTHDPAGRDFSGAVKGRKLKRIGKETYKELFKLLLRLRANMIWPAMHEYTVPFYAIEGAMEVADSCGIIIGTSHCEPMMRNNTTEWNKDERGDFNYLTNKEQVQDYWITRLKESAGKNNVYTLGMRGIHDGNMEGPKTLDEHTFWLQKVIDDQRDMLAKYVSSKNMKIEQAFVPYKEVLQIYENGLKVPDDITLIWCDDNYGYLTRLPDSEQQQRQGGGGIYYHLSYWGRPHSYLWLTTTQPGLIYNELREAYEHNVRKQWIFNIHDPKIAAFNLELSLNMAWQFDSITPSTIDKYTMEWYKREFGADNALALACISHELYKLTGMRKPEFMGWNQIELDRKKYPGGKSPIGNTDFSFSEFGNEAGRYITEYRSLAARYDSIESAISSQKQDALFSAIGYRVKCAAAFAEKLLMAQYIRETSDSIDNSGILHKRNYAIRCVLEKEKEIKALTQRWNTMQNGKWKGLMDDHPQSLPVFEDLSLSYSTADSLMAENIDKTEENNIHLSDDYIKNGINACNYSKASTALTPVQHLGHSMSAVPLPKDEWMEYDIDMGNNDSIYVRIALIPTQASDKGDIRFSVSMAGEQEHTFSIKEPYRSERWKQNVMRGQTIRGLWIKRPANAKGGALRIKALDDHIIVDQIMIDDIDNRHFYAIPSVSEACQVVK